MGAGGGGELVEAPDGERGQAGEDIPQPDEGVEAVGAAGFDESVKDGGAVPGFRFADE